MKEIRLGDYIELLTDYHSGGSYKILRENTKILHKPNYAVMLRTLNFERNDFTNDLIYCDKQSYDFLEYSHLQENDVLMNKIANPGSVYIMPKLNYRATCAMNLFLLRFKKINQRYLYYVMKYHEDYIKTKAHGTTTKTITKDEVRDLVFKIHDTIEEQNKIERLLSSIEDKIALNNKTNTELENMAKTIYDYWFTQFDFPDKNGHPYKTSGGQMVYNETLKREIPAGWEVKNILDCCKVIDCLHSKKPDYCYEDENCYLLQLENLIDLKLIDLTNKYYVSKKDYETWTAKTKVKQGDLVVTNAGRVGGVSRIPNYIETGIGRNMTSIRPISISEYLLCYFFSSSDCNKQIRQNTDQGAFFQSLNVKGIKKLNLTIPPKEIQDKFDSLVGKIRLQIESNHQESEELTKLRDYLLPLLMNGQITIN